MMTNTLSNKPSCTVMVTTNVPAPSPSTSVAFYPGSDFITEHRATVCQSCNDPIVMLIMCRCLPCTSKLLIMCEVRSRIFNIVGPVFEWNSAQTMGILNTEKISLWCVLVSEVRGSNSATLAKRLPFPLLSNQH